MFTKSSVTTCVSVLLFLSGFIFNQFNDLLFSIGLFAVSGSITNWLAVYMLFEKIPFIYGSGVIPNHFQKFKLELRSLIVSEFFSSKQIEAFMSESNLLSGDKIFQKINFDNIFEELLNAIEESKAGSMLQLVGGRKALEPLRKPIIEKLSSLIKKVNPGGAKNQSTIKLVAELRKSLEDLIDKRLNELSPNDVKLLVKKIIKEHLGWLVVWGGVVGGILGLAVNFFEFNIVSFG